MSRLVDMIQKQPAGKPPQPPWRPLDDRGTGYLSVYLSDKLARWPVREVTRLRDNKSDPNIETGTYGLFSTCEPQMRNRIVKDGTATIVFVTSHAGRPRALTGYYHVSWYTPGSRGEGNRDYALAADALRFVDPVPVASLPSALMEVCSSRFRTQKRIGAETVTALRELLHGQQDRTSRYREEVTRLENYARAHSGYSYPSWGREEGFDWESAPDFYWKGDRTEVAPNSTPTGRWRCRVCNGTIINAALLKQCPACKSMASLVPVLEEG